MSKLFWKIEKNLDITSKVKNYSNCSKRLGYYDLVYVEVDNQGSPLINSDGRSFSAFTKEELVIRTGKAFELEDIISSDYGITNKKVNLKAYMVGDLTSSLCHSKEIRFIKINPILFKSEDSSTLLHEQIVVVPIKDSLTGKSILTSPEEGMALLAIKSEDEKRLGMEIVFYCLTNKNLPDTFEEREGILNEKINELSFYSSRVPIKKGSGSILCVILNLENSMEETAFIRNYRTLDNHSDIIFVTSELKIKTGDLHQINYDGNSIDTIFMPIIDWQRSKELCANSNLHL
ncbi:hypothetical protein A9Q84_08455 [Halobacteriovorax marinus]|uniref:Uncharacterized protein n=1 Tax=Halobacteriovorax marinus TaxID=97084 RepID=A0A1Y5F6F4_9BACT|nr:hypothetical protein A9Q84_08455 [Halobacteriovorax marinus]